MENRGRIRTIVQIGRRFRPIVDQYIRSRSRHRVRDETFPNRRSKTRNLTNLAKYEPRSRHLLPDCVDFPEARV